LPLSPPRPPLPPLNALRAVEAAARHGSFLRAAGDLSVSPGAIAQQVKKLEDWSGQTLFVRHSQGVSLTPLGARLLPELTAGFARLGDAARILRHAGDIVPVRIAALPAIAQLWLGPRLSILQRALPQIEISVHALDDKPELTHGDFDLTIYPETPGPDTRILAEDILTPVVSPDMANSLLCLDDLKSATLIHDGAWHSDWDRWLAAQTLSGVDSRRGPVFSLYSLAVEQCVAGGGVLIGHTALLADHLRDGRLTMPFPAHTLCGPALCLGYPAGQGLPGLFGDIIDLLAAPG